MIYRAFEEWLEKSALGADLLSFGNASGVHLQYHQADMTTRQILDRAFLRALNKDISLAGNWEPLDCLAGNESLIAQHIAMLVSGGVDEEKLGRILRRCLSIEDITEALNVEQLGHVNDTDTGSLFA